VFCAACVFLRCVLRVVLNMMCLRCCKLCAEFCVVCFVHSVLCVQNIWCMLYFAVLWVVGCVLCVMCGVMALC